jgi:hypothetical protein
MEELKTGKDYSLHKTYPFYFGEVVNIVNAESGVLQVRIEKLDRNVGRDDIPPCFPISSFQFFKVLPKKGERVVIFLDREYNTQNVNQEKRFWLGVSISQPQNIANDQFYYSSNSIEPDGYISEKTLLSSIPSAKGILPPEDATSIIGRNNADVQLRNESLLLRAGRHDSNDNTLFNFIDPAYIQVQYKKTNIAQSEKVVQNTLRTTPSSHIILVTTFSNSATIKVIKKVDNSVEEVFSQTYTDENEMVSSIKAKIREFQSKYKKWEFRTTDTRFSSLPTLYPNNTKTITEEVDSLDVENSVTIPSTINIVADRINLLSHLSNTYNLNDPDNIIDDNTLIQINEKGQRMVNGDKLVEFLRLLILYVKTHSHSYPGNPPVNDSTTQKISSFNLESLLNDYLRLL